jgi:hypothetical protein
VRMPERVLAGEAGQVDVILQYHDVANLNKVIVSRDLEVCFRCHSIDRKLVLYLRSVFVCI